MKFCILMGSPHAQGNTATLLKPFLQELASQQIEYEYLELQYMQISPCRGCHNCQNVVGTYGCIISDEMQEIVEAILASEVIVFATPVHTWQCTASMKNVMDRLYGLNKYYGQVPRHNLTDRQAFALITTCGYELEYGAGLLNQVMQRWCDHSHLPYLGMLAVRDGEIGDLVPFTCEDAVMQAKMFAQKLINQVNNERTI